MLNLEWYRTFKLVYQLGTFTGAAEELYMSQPGVRKQIGALESYVGQKLFERMPKNVVPTEYAHLLYGQIIGSLENLERVEGVFNKRASGVKPTLQIGSPYEFFSHIFSRRIHNFDFNIRIEFGMAKKLLGEVEKGNLDMAISAINPRGYDVDSKHYFTEELLLVGNKKTNIEEFHNLITGNQLSDAEKWLCKRTWYVYSGNLTLIRRFWRNNFKKRPEIDPRFIIPDLNIIKRCLLYSDKEAISLIPDYLCRNELMNGDLKLIWKGNVLSTNDLFFATNTKKTHRKQIEHVIKVLSGPDVMLGQLS